ncbi:MAG: AzlD domain-containing protein [Chloroflexi bacterium]|nr:AzlD domain-containing protein [Chloroflexota bacterium]
MNELLLVIGMALVTFGVRYPVLVLVGKAPLPPAVVRALKFVPPAVLTAIIAPAVLFPRNAQIEFGLSNEYLVAAVISALVAWRTRNVLLTILIGMPALLIWRWLMGAI